MKKKNLSSIHKSPTDPCLDINGLFASKQSKQRLLQDLKRGTLFKWNHKNEQEVKPAIIKQIFDESRSWLDEIKLGIQNKSQEQESIQKSSEKRKKAVDKLPVISKFLTSPIKKVKPGIQKRCDKITCLTKKLSKIGAWNQSNNKSINKNISRLQKSLNLDQCSFSQDDFWKIQGLNTTQDKSFQSSLIYLDGSSILENTNAFNPFSSFPNFSDKLRHKNKQKKQKKQNVQKSLLLQGQQPSFIPQFLMNSIILQNPKTYIVR